MRQARSADGTEIAYDTVGDGRAVVVVNGAFSISGDAREIAEHIAARGLRAVVYDRRARGESGDTAPPVPRSARSTTCAR